MLLLLVLEDDPLSAAAYQDEPYTVLHNNVPLFSDDEKASSTAFEYYAPLDDLGRCGTAFANLGLELMPEDDRESISSVTPSGWHNAQYDFVSGGWVYNRCHLIGFQLAGENANEQNLITGTRYLNTEGMLPFENMVADYIKETANHVLYRVTPVFKGDNLLCEGVTMEAWSVEDDGEGICFYVFCYNVQDGVVFDYATGDNHAFGDLPDEEITVVTFILNTKSKKFHLLTCRYVTTIAAENYAESGATRDELLDDGYAPCGTCKP
jgi:DNA-entry nuclease